MHFNKTKEEVIVFKWEWIAQEKTDGFGKKDYWPPDAVCEVNDIEIILSITENGRDYMPLDGTISLKAKGDKDEIEIFKDNYTSIEAAKLTLEERVGPLLKKLSIIMEKLKI